MNEIELAIIFHALVCRLGGRVIVLKVCFRQWFDVAKVRMDMRQTAIGGCIMHIIDLLALGQYPGKGKTVDFTYI